MEWNLCVDCVYFHKQSKKPFFSCINKRSEFFSIPLSHKLTWRICDLYEEAIPEWLKGTKFIEDFRNREEFKNSTFWIIGADPNLDFYPDDFFKNKFSIAVNLVWYAFPESTFYIGDWGFWEGMKNDIHCNFKKCIFTLSIQRLRPSARLFGLPCSLQGRDLEPIYMRIAERSTLKSKSDLEPMVRQIFSGGPYIFCSRTTAHLAIFAAAILGARKIVLVACSHKLPKLPVLKFHSHRKGLEQYIRIDNLAFSRYKTVLKKCEQNLVLFAEIFREYGIEVIRHRFDEKKKKFVFEEIK